MTTDDVTLEHLDALAVALFDAVVNLYMGAREELGNLLDLLLLDCADVVHCLILFLIVPFVSRAGLSSRRKRREETEYSNAKYEATIF